MKKKTKLSKPRISRSPIRPNKDKLKSAVRLMLEAMGEDPEREGLRETPRRVANFYEEALAGHLVDPQEILSVYYEQEDHDEIVLVKGIPFYSLCEHHLLPFFGVAHVAYIPQKDRLLGVSKIARVVEAYARRLQLQERITKQVADAMMHTAMPRGAMVVLEAEHTCMTMRGIKKSGSKMVTSAMRGIFLKDARTRSEAMALIR